jgi:K+-sensing histidine kinase KdpD
VHTASEAAKLETKQVDLETADVKVLDLVYEVLAGHPVEAERNSIQVAVEDPSLTVRADRELLAMILAQYIDNARKYSTAGTPIRLPRERVITRFSFPCITLDRRFGSKTEKEYSSAFTGHRS